jgi:small subunit ribosomal protein S21
MRQPDLPKDVDSATPNRHRRSGAILLKRDRRVNLQVFVRDNNVDQALRVLKKKMQREGLFREMRLRRFYEKPSARTTRERTEAIRRARKLARKQAIREGLIVAARKKRPEPTKTNRSSPQTEALSVTRTREANG